jgi:hypothetical protein
VAEQTDYYDGVTFHRYFRYTGHKLGYASSLDGVNFDSYKGNPIMEDSLFPYLVEDGNNRYLIVQHRKGESAYYLYDVSVPTAPKILNGGNPILRGEFFNVGAIVVDSRWHMLVEGKSGETFHLRYTWADSHDLDFNANLGPPIINDAGNPYLTYIPEKKSILALYGADYSSTGKWNVRAAVYDFDKWSIQGFKLIGSVHIADPDMGIGVEHNPIIITVGTNQDAVSTYFFQGNKLEFYNAIITGHVELEELENPTFTSESLN